MYKNFIWQFKLELQEQSFWQSWDENSPVDDPNINYEQRFFWNNNDDIILKGLTEQQLWLSNYDFETHNDCYLLLDDNRNLKFRNKKLHYKPLLNKDNDVYCFGQKQKLKLAKEQDEIAQLLKLDKTLNLKTKEQVKELLKAEFKTCQVYKEALTLKLNQFNNTSIEFSKIKFSEQCFYSMVVEAPQTFLVKKIVKALGIKIKPLDYVRFLKEHQC